MTKQISNGVKKDLNNSGLPRKICEAAILRGLRENNGQAMLLSVIVLGSVLLSAAAIAGLLIVYQIRESNDAVNSGKAIFAADAALEWQSYAVNKTGVDFAPPFPEFDAAVGASATSTFVIDDVTGETIIRSQGFAGSASRALETIFAPTQ